MKVQQDFKDAKVVEHYNNADLNFSITLMEYNKGETKKLAIMHKHNDKVVSLTPLQSTYMPLAKTVFNSTCEKTQQSYQGMEDIK